MVEAANLKKLSDFDNKSLLIVDDDNPFRDRLARAMEKKGFEVFQAEGVQKGILSVKEKKPAFAVVDLRLADGNGLEVVKQIQISNPSSRIIMLTGYGNIPTAVAAIKEGAIDYLAKPADAAVPLGGVINFPTKTEDLHHEVELAVAIGKPGQNIPADSAHDHIFGYAVALDMTRRDVQAEAKRKGRPWDLAKWCSWRSI